MGDMIFRIPSRTVQYGYVELSLPAQSGDSPELLSAMYVNYVYAFQKGEEEALKHLKEATSAPVTASEEAAPGDPQAATDRLADGRKPRTVDEANEMARQVIEQELGQTTELSDDGHDVAEEYKNNSNPPPWKAPAVDTNPKPWETGGKPPAAKPVVDEGW